MQVLSASISLLLTCHIKKLATRVEVMKLEVIITPGTTRKELPRHLIRYAIIKSRDAQPTLGSNICRYFPHVTAQNVTSSILEIMPLADADMHA